MPRPAFYYYSGPIPNSGGQHSGVPPNGGPITAVIFKMTGSVRVGPWRMVSPLAGHFVA